MTDCGPLEGYTAGPLFWIFAENSIAIIGACLPTLAPLWTIKHYKFSGFTSYLKKLRKTSTSGSYADLELPIQKESSASAEDNSVRHLVDLGHTTNIFSDDIALGDRHQQGIGVETTLSTEHTKRSRLDAKTSGPGFV